MRSIRSANVVLVLFVLGCGGDGRDRPSPVDAGADAADEDAGFVPTAPIAPAPPRFTPCPTGWRETPDEARPEIVTCDPWPESGPLDCPDGSAHFPGEAGCAAIGAACGEGDWADDVPADAIFVRAGEPVGGDGTQASPLATIAAALARAEDGDTIAISKGTFDEFVRVEAAVTLVGACVAQTVLARSVLDGNTVTLALAGMGGSSIRGLQVSGVRPGIYVGPDEVGAASYAIESVLVRDTSLSGITVAESAVLDASDLVVRGTREAGALSGAGLVVHDGAHVTIARAAIERNHTTGLAVSGAGTVLEATDLVVRDTEQAEGARLGGAGLGVVDGASATIERVAIERNRGAGVVVGTGAATTLEATDLVIRDTDPHDFLSGGGAGLLVAPNANVTVARASLSGNTAGSIGIFGGGTFTASDLAVLDTRSEGQLHYLGIGLTAEGASLVDLARAAFVRNRTLAIVVGEPETTLTARDLWVVDTASQEVDGDYGYGLQIAYAATADVRRAVVAGSHRGGIVIAETSTSATFEDLVVRDTAERECTPDCSDGPGGGGTGLAALDGATATVTRFVVTGSALAGVQLAGGGTLDLFDGEVSANAVGANVQTEDFDVTRIQDRVRYDDNDQTLDATALPVPEPLGAI